MSVFTTVSADDLHTVLPRFSVGELVDHSGISEGIENTNYFVTTTEGQFVLTLFEATAYDGLPFFLDLMAFLADSGLPTAHPLADESGKFLFEMNERPAALVRRLVGKSVDHPDPDQCRAIAKAMAKMHLLSGQFSLQRDDDRGLAWRKTAAERLLPVLDKPLADHVQNELAHSQALQSTHLPAGIIHADLFKDNALFIEDDLTGIIDFYYAFTGAFAYDLAVLINDWCVSETTLFDVELASEIADAYQSVRPLADSERALWPDLLRHAASRFWLSRLVDQHFPRSGEITTIKDPKIYFDILQHRREAGPELTAIWR